MNQPIYFLHRFLTSKKKKKKKNDSEPNLVMESGIHSSFHQKCHDQIIHVKLYLKIRYQPPYEPEI